MRSLTWFFVLLVGFTAPGSLAHAQTTQPASKADGSSSVSATKEEVNQLRSEVASQRQTIDELKAMVGKLVEANAQATDNASAHVVADETASTGTNAHLVGAALGQPYPDAEMAVVDQPQSSAPKKEAPLTAGWNGEHFFIRSADGQASINPYGYVDTEQDDDSVERQARFRTIPVVP